MNYICFIQKGYICGGLYDSHTNIGQKGSFLMKNKNKLKKLIWVNFTNKVSLDRKPINRYFFKIVFFKRPLYKH